MLTIIRKKNFNYTNKVANEKNLHKGFDIKSEQSFDEKHKQFTRETKFVPAKEDYFPNTDWKENELSYLIPAGIDPGGISMLKVNPLNVGDIASHVNDILEQSNIDDLLDN